MAKNYNRAATRITGIRELRANLADVVAAVTNDRSISADSRTGALATGQQYITTGIRNAARLVRNQARDNATSEGWPSRVVASIFAYSDQPDTPGLKRTTALAGVNKRRSMVKWNAVRHSAQWHRVMTSGVHKVEPGSEVAMSLATMYEFGTSRMMAKPAFRPAVTATKGSVTAILVSAYRQAIQSFHKP